MFDNNLFGVDTAGVEKMGGFEIYPAGLYPAVMISAAKKPTKDNNGAFIECTYQFIEGEMNGKKFTSRMNLWNANNQAVDIARRELKSLRVALGLGDQASDPTQFVNKPVVLNINVKARRDDHNKMENNLVNIEPYGAVQQAAPQYQPQAPAQYAPNPPGYNPNATVVSQPAGGYVPTTQAPAAFAPQPGAPPPWAPR